MEPFEALYERRCKNPLCWYESRKNVVLGLEIVQYTEKIGVVAYMVALLSSLSNLYDVFHVSQLRKYIPDPSHLIQMDDVQVLDNLTVEALPIRIEDQQVMQLRGKGIALVKVL
ncbi:unnamed protein product [Lathyrus oleraceus]